MNLVLPATSIVHPEAPGQKVPLERVRRMNAGVPRLNGDFVLYWMIAQRRTRDNFALDRAVEWAHELDKPLVILEPLRTDYRWASDRLHRFVIDGMRDNAASVKSGQVFYYPYVERKKGGGKGLLEALSKKACAIVTDDYPCFFLPRMVAQAAARVEVILEAVDGAGLLPTSDAPEEPFKTARAFRSHLGRELPKHLQHFPRAKPVDAMPSASALEGVLAPILKRWPAGFDVELSSLPIDHAVKEAPDRGGMRAAEKAMSRFLDERLDRYQDARKHPDDEATSTLSPWLHFGHLSVHRIYRKLRERGAESDAADNFLDELVTWREVGFNSCSHRANYDQYESLPDWARRTLEEHASDPRETIYSYEELECAQTHDDIWNAAQRELVLTGRMHNYLRMLWGKKILEWTPHPRRALEVMIELNNKFALDGRDPNSYSGIFWVLGRYDRPWAPQRQIFGAVRYMSSNSTRKKLHLKKYLERWGPGNALCTEP